MPVDEESAFCLEVFENQQTQGIARLVDFSSK
jgi:hypothetical protein